MFKRIIHDNIMTQQGAGVRNKYYYADTHTGECLKVQPTLQCIKKLFFRHGQVRLI